MEIRHIVNEDMHGAHGEAVQNKAQYVLEHELRIALTGPEVIELEHQSVLSHQAVQLGRQPTAEQVVLADAECLTPLPEVALRPVSQGSRFTCR